MRVVYRETGSVDEKHKYSCTLIDDSFEVIIFQHVFAIGWGETPKLAKQDLQESIAHSLETTYRDGIKMLNTVTKSAP